MKRLKEESEWQPVCRDIPNDVTVATIDFKNAG